MTRQFKGIVDDNPKNLVSLTSLILHVSIRISFMERGHRFGVNNKKNVSSTFNDSLFA